LRSRLLDAQPVTTEDLNALASARATTIVGLLTRTATLDAGRIKILAAAPVKRNKAGSSRIASEMTMKTSGDEE
jgi:hypothetical protein